MCTPQPGSPRYQAVILINDAALDMHAGNVDQIVTELCDALQALDAWPGIIADYRLLIKSEAASSLANSTDKAAYMRHTLRAAAARLHNFHAAPALA